MLHRDINDMERELREAGHEVVTENVEGPPRREHTGAQWTVSVDGEVVARGGAIGEVEVALQRWMAEGHTQPFRR